jgi:hypothetical protein
MTLVYKLVEPSADQGFNKNKFYSYLELHKNIGKYVYVLEKSQGSKYSQYRIYLLFKYIVFIINFYYL